MTKPTLVVMAAGLGSRYGGLKQMAPVDGANHILIDFSIYDAVRAGFDKLVCIIKPEMEQDFHETIGRRVAPFIDLHYAFQRMETLPEAIRFRRAAPSPGAPPTRCCAPGSKSIPPLRSSTRMISMAVPPLKASSAF